MQISRIIRCLPILIAFGFSLAVLLTAGPARATFPGENGRIVFVANTSGSWQLYTINSDGSEMVQITNISATHFDWWAPSFSPDGQRIAFAYGQVDTNGVAHPDLYVVNADGTGLTQLTHDGSSLQPSWSPDGTEILFLHYTPYVGFGTVFKMRADGTGEKIRLTTNLWGSGSGIFAPDGKQIAFDSQQGGFVSRIWIMKANGSNPRPLTAPSLEGGPSDVSPDGRHIVLFNHYNTSLPSQLFVVNLDGTGLRQLTYPPAGEGDLFPVYSPDGAKIVFPRQHLNAANAVTAEDLFIMDADGSDIKLIAGGLTLGGCPDGNCVTPNWGRKP